MNKKAYIICYNHMDPVWRRCFENHFEFEGNVIRPYSDIEEAQFDQWLKIVQFSGCKYSIEQSLTVKKYLKRNPDNYEIFKTLVQEGRIELLGGGEAITDYNMVHGESIVRNHLYSILWYRDNFGRKPDIALTTDAFGLSAQVPQIFRKFGYSALVRYDDYIFKDEKPYWKGLNGDLLFIKQSFADKGIKNIIMIDWMKYTVCEGCKGAGCNVCNYSGIDYTYKSNSMHFSMEELFKQMREAEEETFRVTFFSEEALKTENIIEIIKEYGKKYNIDAEFVTLSDFTNKAAKQYLDSLGLDKVGESDIDARTEGNPYATGCYLTRIELKKMNRELESMLLSCEKFATYANDFGMSYPKRKIARLWNKMSFFQFHDCITASHIDAGYDELIKAGRDVALGAGQVFKEAAQTIERNIDIPEKEGYKPFVVFNPLNWTVKDTILEAVLEVGKNQPVEGLTIIEQDGRLVEVIDFSSVQNQKNKCLKVRFKGVSLPPVGYKVFYFKLDGKVKPLQGSQNDFIENEYYIIKINSHGISSIYDRELKENILIEGAGDIIVEDDWGSPWDTLVPPFFRESTSNPYFLEYVTKREYSVEVKKEENEQRKVVTFKGAYVNKERNVAKLLWKQEITLYKGVRKIYFKTDIDWDAANQRLKVSFPLGFKTRDDEAYYEIPYGTLKRKSYTGIYGLQGSPTGDWPALNFVSCHNEDMDYTVTLFNKGLPCHRVSEGTIYMGLLRSPAHPAAAMFDFDGAKDKGCHTFEYMVTSNKGGLKEGRAVQTGIEFNTSFFSCHGTSKQGKLQPVYSFISNKSENIIITSIKRAENSDHKLIRAYEAYGDTVEDCFDNVKNDEIEEVNLLEQDGKKIFKVLFNGFDIKTFRLL